MSASDNIGENTFYSSGTNTVFEEKMQSWQNAQDALLYAEKEEYENELAAPGENTSKINKGALKAFKQEKLYPYLILAFYIILALHLVSSVIDYVHSVYFVDTEYFNYNSLNVIFWMCTPIIMFIWSTNYKFWNFHLRKYIILWLTTLSIIFELSKFAYLIAFSVFIPLIIKMPLVRGITCVMILYLMQLVLLLFTLTFVIWMAVLAFKLFTNRYTKEDIEAFRINDYINKNTFATFDKYAYNVSVIWKMKTGFKFIIGEKDRFLHMMVDGVTGSGKTSSMLIPMIVGDLDTKVKNEDTLKKQAFEAVRKGELTMKEPFEDKDFNINKFVVKEGHEAVLKKLAKSYRSAGMTIMAPDASLTDQVYDFCEKRGIPCNRIDPEFEPETNKKKPGCVGFNPLYLSPSITPNHPRYHTLVVQKATLFSDVLQAIAELGGKSEQYFASINRNIITAFVILLELTYSKLHNGKQPTPEHLQLLVNDFSRVTTYFNELKSNAEYKERYKFVIDFIQYDIIGEGKKDMLNQARGLRIMLNELLANPSVKEILCSENSIDQDKMLAEGQITVVNYSQEMGDRDATALGLFFALSFNNACLRRPGTEDTRIPHFYVIDEFPVLLHPQFEKCVTLFRKYRVASCFAIQTLDQMEKNDMTRYLSGVLQGNCAHQILYGRVNTTEMKKYQDLAGTEGVATEQDTVSQTSLTSLNPGYSYSTRTTITDENVMSGGEMRNRAFQEVTVFSVKNGSTVKPFHGRLSFLEYAKKQKVKRYHVDWSSLYDDYCADDENVDDTTLLFHAGSVDSLISAAGTITETESDSDDEGTTNEAVTDTEDVVSIENDDIYVNVS